MRDHLFSLIVIGLICAGFVVMSLLSMRLLRRMPDFKYRRDLLRGATWAPFFAMAAFGVWALASEWMPALGWKGMLVLYALAVAIPLWLTSRKCQVPALGPWTIAHVTGETDEELIASAEGMVKEALQRRERQFRNPWLRAAANAGIVILLLLGAGMIVGMYLLEGNLKGFEREKEIEAQLEAELGGPGRVKSVTILDTSTFQIPRPILRVRAEGEPGDDDLVRLAEKAGEALLATGVRGAVDLDVRAADGRVVRGTCDAESRTVELEPVRVAPEQDPRPRRPDPVGGLLRPRGGL